MKPVWNPIELIMMVLILMAFMFTSGCATRRSLVIVKECEQRGANLVCPEDFIIPIK